MTNYRTVTPSIHDGGDTTSLNYQDAKTRQVNYDSRLPYHGMGESSGGTRIPGMDGGTNPNNGSVASGGKPLVGFLVSVSRTDEGEYWVLRQGQNLIGSGENCTIVLQEASVSSIHAVLAIHRNPKDGNRINVGIMDKGSSNGVFVNDEYIGFNPCQCRNLDRIKIGNYVLLLMLFDAVEFNMKKSPIFESKEAGFEYDDRDAYSNDGTRF